MAARAVAPVTERAGGQAAALIGVQAGRKAPTVRVRLARAYRVINSRHPPVDLFERIAEPEDWDDLLTLEQLTNPRMRQEVGEVSRVPVEDRVSGPGASWVMAPFCHLSPSRFSSGSYGVYYAAKSLITSVRETAFHFARFLTATNEPRGTVLEMRVLFSEGLDARLVDLRRGHNAEHDPDDYAPAQVLAQGVRQQGALGIVYRSVRDPGGLCLAVFKPKAIPLPRQGAHLHYHFDGQTVDRYFSAGEDAWRWVWSGR